MNDDNKCFNELVHYIDHDLLEVLSEEQRERIYVLAASAVAIKDRHDKLEERTGTAVSALNREGMSFGDPEPEHDFMWCIRKINPRYVLLGLVALSALASVIF